MSHGPETTPNTDPDRPHDESDAPAGGDDTLTATLTDLFASGRGGGTGGGGSGDGGSGGTGGGGSGPGGTGFGGPGPGGRGGDGPDGDGLDEAALRRMLQGAVGGLEPSEGTLDHLHRAVPARRARRRQAVVGAAAAALLIGTAVPAFVHVAGSDDSSDARPAIAGHGEQAQGGNGTEPGPEDRIDPTAEPTTRKSGEDAGKPDPSHSPSSGPGTDEEGGSSGGASDLPRMDFAALPVCDPSQLGVASAGTSAPGADGTVYGTFRIANVSGPECTVSSNGTVGFTALGAADPLKIDVVQHTAGDAAPGLPDPSLEPGVVALKPSMAYEVRFAWVPDETCPTVGTTPSPTPTSEGAAGTVGEGTSSEGAVPQSLGEDGGTAEGSVAVTHTPETGAPTAETKIPNACSGTIYRTGVLPTP
ncbi:hypothetical protein ACIP6P_20460 [Streptomyces sp. NPDC088729]|uniref:hypothetical protein n=1 Tax=Streptomyces sp. NPDC088729 TaxID=3365876 RepID=UPI0038167C76